MRRMRSVCRSAGVLLAVAAVVSIPQGDLAGAGGGVARCLGHRPTIAGTAGPDRIVGTDGHDVIAAGSGDDVVRGLGGSDLLCGNGGDDVVRAGKGDDGMDGGAGDDRLLGGRGFDLIGYEAAPRPVRVDLARGVASGHGRDRVESVWWVLGSRFGDRIQGANQMEILMPLGGDDRVSANGGRDLIDAGPGDDRLAGGRGDDVLLGQDGADDFVGGRGSDTASFAGARRPVTVDLAAGDAGGEGRDTLTGLENVEGSPRADTIAGDRGRNTIVGAEGADRVRARGGNDRWFGLMGDDRVRLGAGDDVGRGGRDDDYIDGGFGIDRVYGGAGHDVCRNGEVLGCDEYELPLPDRRARPGAATRRRGRA